MPDAVARSDARPPVMRTVAGSIFVSGNFDFVEIGHEIIFTAADSRRVMPDAAARSDARLTSMRTVAGSIFVSGNFYFVESGHEIIFTAADSRRAVVSYWRKNAH